MTELEKLDMLKNEYREIYSIIKDPKHGIVIESVPKGAGLMARFKVTVKKDTYYVSTTGTPTLTHEIEFFIDIPQDYPVVPPYFYFPVEKRCSHVNVFESGKICIDKWIYDPQHAGNNTTLLGAFLKTIMLIIFDPTATRYDSMANGDFETWQKKATQERLLPMCRLNELIKSDNEPVKPALPVIVGPKKVAPSVPRKVAPTVSKKVAPPVPKK